MATTKPKTTERAVLRRLYELLDENDRPGVSSDDAAERDIQLFDKWLEVLAEERKGLGL